MKLAGTEKVLIIKPSAFGDILHALPLLDRLKTVYPNLRVSWIVNRGYEELLVNNPLIDRVYTFERKRWGQKGNVVRTIKEFYSFIKTIRQNKYDVVIDLQGLLRSGLITLLSGAKHRIGLSCAREASRYSYNHIVTTHDRKRHAVDRYLLVSGYLELDSVGRQVKFPLFWGKEVDDKIAGFLKDNSILETDLKIALNPNARWDSKRWAPEKFADLADKLIDKYGAKVVFIGAKSDMDTAQKIFSMMEHTPICAVGRTTPLELACLLKNMDILVTNDTGPMHMAVAVETPVIALFGPTDPLKTGPYGNGDNVLRKYTVCQPCFKHVCSKDGCMNLISVDEVLESVTVNLKDMNV